MARRRGVKRRSFVSGAGAAMFCGLAGCLGDGTDGENESTPEDRDEETGTPEGDGDGGSDVGDAEDADADEGDQDAGDGDADDEDANDEDANGESEDDGDEEPDDEERAARHIDAAVEAFDQADEELDAESDRFSDADDPVDFETGQIHDLIAEGTDELDEAEPLATPEQRETIRALRSYADWLSATTDAMAAFGSGLNEFETANALWDDDRFEDAEQRIETALEQFDEATRQLTIAESELEDVDPDAVETLDQIGLNDARRSMEDLRVVVETMSEFSLGFRDLSRGFDLFSEGAEAYDSERYREAIGPFEEAQTEFASAHTTFRDGEEDAPPEFVEDFVALTCLSGAMRDAADHFVTSAEAADEGDTESAQQAASDAEEAIGRC